ncbi:MAG: hypothetical protein V1742_00635, partial [Pseudomonadota bacterium]
AKGEVIFTMEGHKAGVSSVCFSPDGKRALSGGTDNTMRLWDLKTGREIAQFVSFADGGWVVITPEGYFNASPAGAAHVEFKEASGSLSLEQLLQRFKQPDLVKKALIPSGNQK